MTREPLTLPSPLKGARVLRRAFAIAVAFVALVAIGLATSPVEPAAAHPLGNFTINRYARIDLTSGGASVRYVVDMAEIPAFTEIKGIDRDGDGVVSGDEASAYLSKQTPSLLGGLDLRFGDERVDLRLTEQSLTTPAGQGGLDTLRIVLDAAASLPKGWESGAAASFEDRNFSDRLGWREVVVRNGEGVSLASSSAPSVDVSAELTAYPENQLASPLNVTRASFRFEAGAGNVLPSSAPKPVAEASREKTGSEFARLVSRERLTPAVVAVALLAAMVWGAAHALGPGHGKTIVAAYLVGERGTAKHAVVLGLTVTAAHTSSVMALGFATLYLSRFVQAEDLYAWISVASGVMVVAMGALLLVSRVRSWRRGGSLFGGGHHEHRVNDDPDRLATYADLALPKTLRAPYGASSAAGAVRAILLDGTTIVRSLTPTLAAGHKVELVLTDTAFDTHGHMRGVVVAEGGRFAVDDAQAVAGNGVVAHFGRLESGSISVGDAIETRVDPSTMTEHEHGHGHSHEVRAPGWRGLIALGISGGILPCPTALVVMLGAIALERVAYGLALIVAFSFGLAAVLTGIGVLLVVANRTMSGSSRISRVVSVPAFSLALRAAPVVSAAVIMVAGLVLTGRAVGTL